jgi:predicted transposase YbfD/YdcC
MNPKDWEAMEDFGHAKLDWLRQYVPLAVERECTQGDTTTVERRFFIASIPADAKLFAKAVRGHWGIENTLHWRLDVTFSEDASRIRKGNGPAMMTSIRHLCIKLFEREDSKLSLPKKQNKAAWDDTYRAKVLFA